MASKGSAGFRLPSATSSYHQQCIASSVKAMKEAQERSGSGQTYSMGAYQKCNAVAQEKIWSEHCKRELTKANQW